MNADTVVAGTVTKWCSLYQDTVLTGALLLFGIAIETRLASLTIRTCRIVLTFQARTGQFVATHRIVAVYVVITVAFLTRNTCDRITVKAVFALQASWSCEALNLEFLAGLSKFSCSQAGPADLPIRQLQVKK